MSKAKSEQSNNQTFVVKILNRQNATWQGTVHWAESDNTMRFRSALELIMMIEDTLNKNDD